MGREQRRPEVVRQSLASLRGDKGRGVRSCCGCGRGDFQGGQRGSGEEGLVRLSLEEEMSLETAFGGALLLFLSAAFLAIDFEDGLGS